MKTILVWAFLFWIASSAAHAKGLGAWSKPLVVAEEEGTESHLVDHTVATCQDDHRSTKQGPSPIYSQLPKGAERHRVRNVYDGDTMTLVDERRVRFLGIDTPEIKQRYSQEAKAYTKQRCHKQDVWLSYEPGQKISVHP